MDDRQNERERMVAEQIAPRGITDGRVLSALRTVPRHRFIVATDESTRHSVARAYDDGAQPIGVNQTISQPFIVALMSQALSLTGNEKVLEIGAGSGYQTAVLSLLAREVWAIERHASLARQAQTVLTEWGAKNVHLLTGDGSYGLPEHAPYDAILVAANAPEVPPALVQQLAPSGKLILPVGPERGEQRLLLLTKTATGEVTTTNLGAVSFVPLVGAHGFGLPDDLGQME
jgi:protein-L-isoaspartate(D-aspartate) O-methyltransferase